MIGLPGSVRVFLYRGPADLRRGFDGLAALAQHQLKQDVFGGALFVFVNRRRDRVKILYWSGDGFCLWYKRLERGTFRLPVLEYGRTELSSAELLMVLEGITPLRVNRRYRRPLPATGTG